MLHHAGLGIGSLKFDTELLNQKRADQTMAIPDSRADLAPTVSQDNFAVVRLFDKFRCLESRNRLVDRCLRDAKRCAISTDRTPPVSPSSLSMRTMHSK